MCIKVELENASAFVCGVKPEHVCDHKGPTLVFDREGNHFRADSKKAKQIEIMGGCVSCSTCGKPYSPPMY